MRRYIIDTDPGVDDALALLLAFGSAEIQVEALTIVSGNVGAELGVRNALLTIEAAELAHPPLVAMGAVKPLEREAIGAAHIHGEDGLGGAAADFGEPARIVAPAPAHDVLLETISYNPHEISVIALGPLTNLARAFLSDPGTMALAREIIIMGGALRLPGNATPAAEFNFYADPEAARIMMGSGAPITLVGLDVTTHAVVERSELAKRAHASSRSAAGFAERISRRHFDLRELHLGRADCPMHDPLAVAVAIDPTFVRTEPLVLDVETDGRLTTGMLIADLRESAPQPEPSNAVAAAFEVDDERFRAFFLDRVFG